MSTTAPETAPVVDPAPVATDPAPAVTDPPAPVETDPDAPEGETEDARVKRANSQAAASRVALRAQEAKVTELEGTLAKLAAVFNPEATPTADPAEQLATITTESETLRSTNVQLTAALLVHELAPEGGGDPNALLDSRRFTDTLAGLDPSTDDYRTKVADAIKAAATASPTLRAGQVPSRGGSPDAGQGAGSGTAVSADKFASMSYADKTDLFATNPTLYRQLAGTGT